jgi:hypothetical protein
VSDHDFAGNIRRAVSLVSWGSDNIIDISYPRSLVCSIFKNNFIKQIPSLIKQKFLQTRETLKGGVKQAAGQVMGRGGASEYALEDDDDDEKMEGRKEVNLKNARKIKPGEPLILLDQWSHWPKTACKNKHQRRQATILQAQH